MPQQATNRQPYRTVRWRTNPRRKFPLRLNRLRRSRVGLGAFEVLISVALLSVVLGLAAGMSTAAVRHRRVLERQRVSLQEAANLMQVAMALPYAELTTPKLIEATEALAMQAVDGSKWQLSVDEVDSSSKRIAIELVWDAASGIESPNAPLVAYRYALADDGIAEGTVRDDGDAADANAATESSNAAGTGGSP